MNNTYHFFILFCGINLLFSAVYGQRKMSRDEYIDTYKEIAIIEMREYKIPASITLAQGILESGCGGSILATEANNHFGIKCHVEWNGKSFFYDDDEKNECFRVYADPRESFHDHSLFLTTRDRYKPLFALEITDYESWAHGLKKSGYATNPQYAHLLIKIIEEQNLSLYDKIGLDNSYAVITPKAPDVEIVETKFIPKTPLPEYHKVKTSKDRDIYENNGVKFTFAKENDSYYRIAEDFDMYSYQLFNYNEKAKNLTVAAGEIVYLEKKKKKGVVTHYFVQTGETILDVSQKTGMTTKAIYQKNRMRSGAEVSAGTMLWLVKKKP